MTPLLSRFAERFPIPTMARALLERCLNPQQLDAWFKAQAEGQLVDVKQDVASII